MVVMHHKAAEPRYGIYPVRTPPTFVGDNNKIADGSVMLLSAESQSARSNGVYIPKSPFVVILKGRILHFCNVIVFSTTFFLAGGTNNTKHPPPPAPQTFAAFAPV